MTMPNFFIIGAGSCGTTSLYEYLKQHPQIFMSPMKEPHFFSMPSQGTQDKSAQTMSPLEGHKRRGGRSMSWEEYEALFETVSDEIAIGESSTSYLSTPSTPRRIQAKFPDAKLVAILRNPADRAYSAYKREVLRGKEPISKFSQALQQESMRIQRDWHPRFFYKLKGFYYEQLQRYFEVFDRENIKIYLYEDLTHDPINMVQDLFQFLGVDDTFAPNMTEKYNTHKYIPKNQSIERFFKHRRLIKAALKPFLSRQLGQAVLANFKNWNKTGSHLPPKIRTCLIQDYQEDILKVQDLINRDLSHWLK